MQRYIPRVTSRESQEPLLASKGSSKSLQEADFKNIEDLIIRLRLNSEVSQTDHRFVEDVAKLGNLARKLYSTEAYETFYGLIARHFGDLTSYKPGSVGAFAYGCHQVKTSDVTPGCAPLCAGGIPPPKLPKWADCSHNVTLLHIDYSTPGTELRQFQTLHASKTSTHTYIFILLDSPQREIESIFLEDEDFENAGLEHTKTYQTFLYRSGGSHLPLGGPMTRMVEESEFITESSEEPSLPRPLAHPTTSTKKVSQRRQKRHQESGLAALIVFLIILVLLAIAFAVGTSRLRR